MKFREYEWQAALKKENKIYSLGLTSGSTYYVDPKRLLFLLSRYKFVAKMFSGFSAVAEIGCGDGFGSRVVRQEVLNLDCYDIDPTFISDARLRVDALYPINFNVDNILDTAITSSYQGIYSLDVLEHISVEQEDIYLKNITKILRDDGCLIVGMPSLESQPYATADKNEHINCKNGADLKKLLLKYFRNVFLFSMNDEVVHTGFTKMAHYNLCLCTSKIK